MPAGRPTKYNAELLKKAWHYLKHFDTHYDNMIPSIEGLSFALNVSRQVIYNWSEDEDKSEFIDILEKINAKQKMVLMDKGLSGEFNSNITKLALGKHGFSEKSEIDHNMNVNIDSNDAGSL